MHSLRTLRRCLIGAFAAASMAVVPASFAADNDSADYTVGFITSLSGPVASLGIPYQKGMKAALEYESEVNGHKIKFIELDDASNPSSAARNARKLINEDEVDTLIGTAGSPGAMAIAGVAREGKTPLISIAHVTLSGDEGAWTVTVPQPATLMVDAVVERMKNEGVKTIGYIGFSDAWGDQVYEALTESAKKYGLEVQTNERYARSDSSVAGQILKVMAQNPDAVITGASGTPAALPYLELQKRGYQGKLYGTHALINPEFVRVGGSAVNGLIAPTGPVIVADQLPDDNPIRAVAMDFRKAYETANGEPPTDAFSAYSFDAWLIFTNALKQMPSDLKPGTEEFRTAMRDAIDHTKELVGTHAVYNFTPDSRYGVDERARVIVKLEDGKWILQPDDE